MHPQIFISYAREDAEVADLLYEDLKKAGARPWMDTKDLMPGHRWKSRIRKAIKNSRYFLILLSSDSVSKQGFVHKEMRIAFEVLSRLPENQIFVLPVRLDDCEPSHEWLEDLHWTDLFPSYENGLNRILQVVFENRTAAKRTLADFPKRDLKIRQKAWDVHIETDVSISKKNKKLKIRNIFSHLVCFFTGMTLVGCAVLTIFFPSLLVFSNDLVLWTFFSFLNGFMATVLLYILIHRFSISKIKKYFFVLVPGCIVLILFSALKPSGNMVQNSLGMEFVFIAPGHFQMGSPDDETGRFSDEKLADEIIGQPFYMQTTEVTQGQWQSVMGGNPSYHNRCGENCPVENVSWNDVQAFINKLNKESDRFNYQLPTQKQWEYVCRSGSQAAFCNGGITESDCGPDMILSQIGWYCGNSGYKLHPVAGMNPNEWGVYDMHGNVWEWCLDMHESGDRSHRSKRGGSWKSRSRFCRSAHRAWAHISTKDSDLGFRLVLTTRD